MVPLAVSSSELCLKVAQVQAVMHKFHLGQSVTYRARYAPPGACVVTAKLPERNGEYEYRIRNLAEKNERMARESELQAVTENETAPAGKGKRP